MSKNIRACVNRDDYFRLALKTFAADELSDEFKLKVIYAAMRPFKKKDFENGSPVMRDFIDGEFDENGDNKLSKIFYKDTNAPHHPEEPREFKTQMSLKGAMILLVAFARKTFGKEKVKSVMKNFDVSFKKFGRNKARKKFIKKHNPVIKLRDEA